MTWPWPWGGGGGGGGGEGVSLNNELSHTGPIATELCTYDTCMKHRQIAVAGAGCPICIMYKLSERYFQSK